MKLLIRVQSISDIITNSSSEVFVVTDHSTSAKTLKEILYKVGDEFYPNENCSGMGGELDICTFDDNYEWWKSNLPENKQNLASKEIYSLQFAQSLEELEKCLWVDIDWSRTSTIKWMIDNLDVLECSGPCRVNPETGKIVEIIGWQEWERLPETERN